LHGAPRVQGGVGLLFEFVVAGDGDIGDPAPWAADGIVITPLEAAPAQTSDDAPLGPSAFVAPSHFVRVDLGRLDDLMRIMGEMVVHRARLEDQINRLSARNPAANVRAL